MRVITGICVSAAVLALHSSMLQAKVSIDTSSNDTRLERCSTTLNQYLHLRHNNSSNLVLINELEEHAAIVCQGFQVQLEQKDGQMIGVIR